MQDLKQRPQTLPVVPFRAVLQDHQPGDGTAWWAAASISEGNVPADCLQYNLMEAVPVLRFPFLRHV